MTTTARVATHGAKISWPTMLVALSALAASGVALRPAAAQDAPPLATASADELAVLVGPIALYPDDLIAIVLPASTYPLQVVQAARFLEERKGNESLEADEDWDDSVIALLNYPEVVALLNDDLDWTYDLGTAVLNQQADVLDAIQTFRDQAYAAGNLVSDDRQTVTREGETIAIKPADPKVIYVPYYEPARVVVRYATPAYYYYPWAYPAYYYPYPAGYAFGAGFFWGVSSWFSIGWHTHHVHVYDYNYHHHPYYGYAYYSPFYVRGGYVNVNVNVSNGYAWQPYQRYGGRPVVRGYEGRAYTADAPPRVSNGVSGSSYRSRSSEGRSSTTEISRAVPQSQLNGANRSSEGRASTAPSSRAAPSGQPNSTNRSVTGSAYRNRSVVTTERAQQDAALSQPSRAPSNVAGSEGAYRSRVTSPTIERSGVLTQSNREVGANPGGQPRASSGMPRESVRGMEMRSAPSAPASPAPSTGGASSSERGGGSPRSDGGGSYRSGDGGGNARGGGSAGGQSVRRGGEGR